MNYATTFQLTLLATALIAPATGCASEDDLAFDTTTGGDEEAEFRTTPGTTTTGATTFSCGEKCGENSPEVNGYPIRDFDLAGAANDEGVRFQGLRSPLGVLHTLGFVGDEPVALDGTNQIVAQGQGLVDWTIDLDLGGVMQQITFMGAADIGGLPMWNESGIVTLPRFALAFHDPVNHVWKNLCPEFLEQPNAARVTVLAGERYDIEEREVIPNMPTWVTLACHDQAAYKMKRLGYGPHGERTPGTAATVGERQAAIKMLTADYCGDGTPFTEVGTLVEWRNAPGTVDMEDPNDAVEALWDSEGALCLSTPRFAPIEAVHCELPACTPQMIAAGDWEWITRNVEPVE
jgi:hypothetical protein